MPKTKRDQFNHDRSNRASAAGDALTIEQFKKLRQQVQAVILALASVAEQRDISYEEVVEEGDEPRVEPLAEVLRRRASRLEEPFRLAIVGEFSRGKSSLINALLQREVLASDHRPNTAAQTILKYGQPDRFKVTYLPEFRRAAEAHTSNNLLKDLARFTSDADVDSDAGEDVNAKYAALLNNEQQSLADTVARVEVWFQNDFLQRRGIEIIDTPGLGAVFRTHEKVTLKTLNIADAILFAIQIDPGIDGREVAFIRLIREHVSKIFFVVTKIDLIPDREELAERVDHIRKIIEIKAKVKLEYIFPVSAHQALQGDSHQSGFPVFLPSLEQFLVQANGIGRLLGPLRFTGTQARHVLKLQKEYIQRLDSSRAELEKELRDLKLNAHNIQAGKEALLDYVEERMKITRLNVLSSVDSLWDIIRRKVESEIASLSSSDLRNADAFIQAAIKEAVAGWIEQRKSSFVNDIRSLSRKVIQDLKDLLQVLAFDEAQLSLIRNIEVDVDVPINTSQFTSDIGDRIMRTLLSAGISNTIASVAGSLVRAASNFFSSVKRGFLSLFGRGGSSSSSSSSQSQDNSEDVRRRLYQALMNVLPGTSVNTYQAVVEGYSQNGRQVDGVRQVIRNTFTAWGDDLNRDITSLINNNLQTRLHNLQSQLDGQSDELRERTDEKVHAAKIHNELERILQTVAGLEKELREVGAD